MGDSKLQTKYSIQGRAKTQDNISDKKYPSSQMLHGYSQRRLINHLP